MLLDTIPSIAWSAATFVAGVASKSLIDSYFRRREESRKFVLNKRVKFLKQQLSHFYWPIYLHLQKDNLIWDRLRDRDQDPDSAPSRLSRQIETGVILPNHKDALAIIESKLHLAGDTKVVEGALRYVRHVKVYEMLREAGIKGDPINFGEPYPNDFFHLIEKRVNFLQSEFDKLIRQSQDQ